MTADQASAFAAVVTACRQAASSMLDMLEATLKLVHVGVIVGALDARQLLNSSSMLSGCLLAAAGLPSCVAPE